jgi:hypothetical protein
MYDGGAGSGGTLNLNTDSFTEESINFLLDTKNDKFKLKCRKYLIIHSQWKIVILKSQVLTVADLLIQHMHPAMYYKVGRYKSLQIIKISLPFCLWRPANFKL